MDKKTSTLILSFAIFSSFFLPLFDWHSFEMNGLNYILSTHIPSYKYFLLLIPFSALFLFWGAANDDIYFFNRKILSWMPLLSIVFIFIIRYMNRNAENNFSDNGNFFSTINTGFWLMLFFSLLLVFVNEKKETLSQTGKMNEGPLNIAGSHMDA